MWQIQEERFRLLDPKEFHALLFKVKLQVNEARQGRIRRLQSCHELTHGIDWTVNHKTLKKLPRERANALRALQQGALKPSTSLKEAWCVLCGCEATLRHVLWECKLWHDEPAPDHVLDLKAHWGSVVPRLAEAQEPFAAQLTGAWTGGRIISDPEIRYAIAFKVKASSIEVVATAIGAVPCEQTVFRAEAMAALFVAEHTEGDIDVTLDCLGVKKQTESHKISRKSEDLFDGLRSAQDRLNMFWIRSHLSQAEFVQEYCENQLWRWQANREVDYIVGQAANSGRSYEYEDLLKQQDQNAHVALNFLSERVYRLFSVGKEEGQQIEFRHKNRVERSSSEESSTGKRAVSANSKPHLKPKGRGRPAKPSPTEQAAPLIPPSPLNKRDRMKLAMAESWGGHSWTYTSERADGACMRCQTCNLGVQQNCTEWRFDRLITHPCKSEATVEFFRQTWQIHASHDMQYVGPTWECKVCGRVHKPGAEKPQQVFLQPCSAASMTKACKTKRAKAPGSEQASASANPTNQSCESEVVGPGAGEPVAAVIPGPSRPKPKPQPKTGSLKQTKLFFK